MVSGNGIEGKVAVVTGGGSGIGEAIVREMAGRGAKVVVADFNLQAAESVVAHAGANDMAAAVKVDVADPPSVEEMVRFAMEKYGRLDIASWRITRTCSSPT